jgi:hypothetical protein
VSFSADWLALREPHDARARNAQVLHAAIASIEQLPSVTIVDLACGTGSTMRAVAPRIASRQQWRLVDNDLGLLARAADSAHPVNAQISATPLDLMLDLEAALDGAVDLVTTSALLDLVSEHWLERLTVEMAARRIPLYAALSYDGRIVCDPADPFDRSVINAVDDHQRRDKGFGPALGPKAGTAAIVRFEALGYSVARGSSDWTLGPADRAIQIQLLAGWALAAREMDRLAGGEIADWLERRQGLVNAGRSSMAVGHVDLFAAPGSGLARR